MIDRQAHRHPGVQVQLVKESRGTASMTEPPTLRKLVICMSSLQA